ncbi:MAG: hypothetical protein JRG97_12900 [Deltaproteobacteria bacterium]|nr:hypothetical protein [Deltaproteobacteria bacterium]MBW2052121.1 hypothetical protein [Deltaproteobacteria bacterium]MBW2141946.1 hypothetical protein [Deltaproteobacteria bacterium]MBW2324543.1 hypothetical protein [Deltaproteobacteria bacterium]
MTNDIQLSQLVNMDSTEEVLKEGLHILDLISSEFDTVSIVSAFHKTVSLYRGGWPGYKSCNTGFHDLRHMTDTFLAMARLIHGAIINGQTFSDRRILVALIATILHDAGYIQKDHDMEGTGAKYTACHVQRSMDFLEYHAASYDLSREEISEGRVMILCTDLVVDISAIEFPSRKAELLGKMLGSADLLAQMADRNYLEKLLFLYHEFKEAGVGDYESEVDLLRKTIGFYDFIANRLEMTLDATDRFMGYHFIKRWSIHTNLYREAIEKQRGYLRKILETQDSDPRPYLKRSGIIERVREKYGIITEAKQAETA